MILLVQILSRSRLYVKVYCVDRNILRGPLSAGSLHCVDIFSCRLLNDSTVSHLKTLSDQLSHFTVLRVLLPPDDELYEAGGVPEHGGGVGLGDAHETRAVHLES